MVTIGSASKHNRLVVAASFGVVLTIVVVVAALLFRCGKSHIQKYYDKLVG